MMTVKEIMRDLPAPTVRSECWSSATDVPASESSAVLGCGRAPPKITIVTPSYNQGQFIEDTIRSVLLQGYPNFEYIIMDGNSTDDTVEVIRKYEPWITYWESTPDRGQAHAINKGLERATGDIWAYINSDDYYLPNAFWYAARTFLQQDWDLCIGNRDAAPLSARTILRRSEWKPWLRPLGAPFLVGSSEYSVSQEATFWSARCAAAHRFDESLYYMLDVDWFCRIASGARVLRTSKRLGVPRAHPASKTCMLGGQRPLSEFERVARRWRLENGVQQQADEIASSFRRSWPLYTLKHYLAGPAEFIYTHPACQERPLGSDV